MASVLRVTGRANFAIAKLLVETSPLLFKHGGAACVNRKLFALMEIVSLTMR
jgi:hypothetical protein